MQNLTFWTGNPHKLSEASAILWIELKWYAPEDLEKIKNSCNWDLTEIQSMDVIEIIKRKAKDAYEILWRPIMIEDTGLFIEALNGFPWPLVKYVIDWPWLEAIFKMMAWFKNRSAEAITGVCMYDWDEYTIWYWCLKWNIVEVPRWDKFWYSNAFEPVWSEKTFWEMTEDEKNLISMRRIAFLDFVSKLKNN
ncbi:MAG: hypothetical protein ACD_3C00202G0001 [uncultured bacterium (gcode 4)]|uniref:Ham1 family protein n=1 Tax=uncultured bacterium (gcode 4) TaxID=1234023 RepID=K2GVV5_9BACT|nr:MAG: hypothetical protein ACD_3C00202G0001 [uncultured bacterium (gcode 4)]